MMTSVDREEVEQEFAKQEADDYGAVEKLAIRDFMTWLFDKYSVCRGVQEETS